jgi:transposase
MGRSTDKETGLSEQRKYRSWTAQQKLEIVLAGMRGDRSVRDVCREHGIAETLYYGWRDKILEAGREALAGKEERSGDRELRRKIGELERALGRKTYELEIAGKASHGLGGAPACPHYFWSMRFRGWMEGLWLSEPICVWDARPRCASHCVMFE